MLMNVCLINLLLFLKEMEQSSDQTTGYFLKKRAKAEIRVCNNMIINASATPPQI